MSRVGRDIIDGLTGFSRELTPTNVLAIVKDDDKYIFLYDNDSEVETLNQIGQFANDPDLNFDWGSAAKLSQSIGRLRALREHQG